MSIVMINHVKLFTKYLVVFLCFSRQCIFKRYIDMAYYQHKSKKNKVFKHEIKSWKNIYILLRTSKKLPNVGGKCIFLVNSGIIFISTGAFGAEEIVCQTLVKQKFYSFWWCNLSSDLNIILNFMHYKLLDIWRCFKMQFEIF